MLDSRCKMQEAGCRPHQTKTLTTRSYTTTEEPGETDGGVRMKRRGGASMRRQSPQYTKKRPIIDQALMDLRIVNRLSRRTSFHAKHALQVRNVSYSPLPIDIAPMSDLINHNDVFVVKNLVNYAVIAYAELVQSCQGTFIGLWPNGVQIPSKPVDALNNSMGDRFTQALQVAGRVWEDLDAIHGHYANSSRRTTSSNGSPRSPAATAFF